MSDRSNTGRRQRGGPYRIVRLTGGGYRKQGAVECDHEEGPGSSRVLLGVTRLK
jgi:hypothetical protein